MMAKLPKKVTNTLVLVVIAAVIAGAAVYAALSGGATKKLTAQFASAVGVYVGTPVKILGIDVGEVTSVHPAGATVTVSMEYDSKYKVPANAIAVIIANSLVSDRFLQLAPAYPGTGPALPDGAHLGVKRTAYPAELDDIYSALSKLSVALGPKGANKNGALNDLVNVAAANLKGNGANFGNSITKLAAAARTLANGRGDLFGTVRNLQTFTKALADSDTQVRHFNNELALVAGDLAGERQDLGSALHNLGIALNQVADFVRTNASKTKTDISGLKTLTDVLVKEKASINETLAVGPAALANLVHTYQPDIGALGTRSNLASLTDPATICALLDPSLVPTVPNTVKSPLGPITGVLKSTCKKVLGKIGPGQLSGLLGLPGKLVGGQLGKAINDLVGTVSGGGSGSGGGAPGSPPGGTGLPGGIITGGGG
ncbi:MAG TPA: MCE family protein [Jatrophihabitans sp.]|jgi:phospholipid/cholesterol/gamma-HCH transport system substrate-binding protein